MPLDHARGVTQLLGMKIFSRTEDTFELSHIRHISLLGELSYLSGRSPAKPAEILLFQ